MYQILAYLAQVHTLPQCQATLSVEHGLVELGAEANEDSMDITLVPLAHCPSEVSPTIYHDDQNTSLFMSRKWC